LAVKYSSLEGTPKIDRHPTFADGLHPAIDRAMISPRSITERN
jgi:hypothetical protein